MLKRPDSVYLYMAHFSYQFDLFKAEFREVLWVGL